MKRLEMVGREKQIYHQIVEKYIIHLPAVIMMASQVPI